MTNTNREVMQLLGEAKKLARRYRTLTGKPLGITGEVAEFEAARLLNLQLTEARQVGYDIRLEKGIPTAWRSKDAVFCRGRSPDSVSARSTSARSLMGFFWC